MEAPQSNFRGAGPRRPPQPAALDPPEPRREPRRPLHNFELFPTFPARRTAPAAPRAPGSQRVLGSREVAARRSGPLPGYTEWARGRVCARTPRARERSPHGRETDAGSAFQTWARSTPGCAIAHELCFSEPGRTVLGVGEGGEEHVKWPPNPSLKDENAASGSGKVQGAAS
ncbi:hypothetical protein TREES_T100003024 [Tupaia chinensis]|uniref:Uncharacterized protein n=1 Tax=Tupaia chinensis TaxID=246437 RepID=L9KPH4_TUPCH|nr:hypothetical protein TREES_T100003024 [Tupaia chinensis]